MQAKDISEHNFPTLLHTKTVNCNCLRWWGWATRTDPAPWSSNNDTSFSNLSSSSWIAYWNYLSSSGSFAVKSLSQLKSSRTAQVQEPAPKKLQSINWLHIDFQQKTTIVQIIFYHSPVQCRSFFILDWIIIPSHILNEELCTGLAIHGAESLSFGLQSRAAMIYLFDKIIMTLII